MTTAISSKTCTVHDCRRSHKARGMCNAHYVRAKRAGQIANLTKPSHCTVDGCQRRRHALEFCALHYDRWRRTGTTDGAVIQQLPRDELVRLRRAHGIPDDGPTPEMRARWIAEERADELGVAV